MFKRFLALAAVVAVGGATAVYAADHGHGAHGAHGAPGANASKVEHTHQEVRAGNLMTTFHFNTPEKAVYACSMHPEVTSEKPGKCPTCKMNLSKQTHLLALALMDTAKKPVMDAKVHLVVKDAHGMTQQLMLKPAGNYHSGAFVLMPGQTTLVAHVTRGAAKPVEVKTTYMVK